MTMEQTVRQNCVAAACGQRITCDCGVVLDVDSARLVTRRETKQAAVVCAPCWAKIEPKLAGIGLELFEVWIGKTGEEL